MQASLRDRVVAYLESATEPAAVRDIIWEIAGDAKYEDVNNVLADLAKEGRAKLAQGGMVGKWSIVNIANNPDPVSILQRNPQDIYAYIETEEFPRYMQTGSNVAKFVSALYDYTERTQDPEILSAVIRRDKRDKQHSVSYLWAFRKAVVNDQKQIATSISHNIIYTDGLIADALQADKEITHFLNETYLMVMREMHGLTKYMLGEDKESFFKDYVAYRILSYYSEEELLANLISADNVEYLWLVDDISRNVLEQYIEWKYAFKSNGKRNEPWELAELLAVIQRFPNEEDRQHLRAMLENEDPGFITHAMTSLLYKFDNVAKEEPSRRATLSQIRNIIAAAEQRDLDTQKRVKELIVDPVNSVRTYIPGLAQTVSSIVAGRYRYLPA